MSSSDDVDSEHREHARRDFFSSIAGRNGLGVELGATAWRISAARALRRPRPPPRWGGCRRQRNRARAEPIAAQTTAAISPEPLPCVHGIIHEGQAARVGDSVPTGSPARSMGGDQRRLAQGSAHASAEAFGG